jgi:hypothetical protein
METQRKRILFWLVCFVLSALAGGCASSASIRHQKDPEDGATAAQPPDERAYRDAAEKLLEYLDAQRRTGRNVVQASGKKDGIYPMYECMEYGCPDKVFCEETGATVMSPTAGREAATGVQSHSLNHSRISSSSSGASSIASRALFEQG